MASMDFDFFVIGAGSGGVRAARIAAGHGARVGIAEDRYLGGTCVNVGCVPKKLFVYASHFRDEFEDAAGYGWSFRDEPSFSWTTLRENKNQEIARLNGVYENLLANAGVELVNGRARLVDANTVEIEVAGKAVRYTAERILIATGGWPVKPDIPGAEYMIDSNDVFYLDSLPSHAVIIGGGYIACEFAGIFAGLGVETCQLYRKERLLRGFDQDLGDFITAEMAKRIDLRLNAVPVRVERAGEGYHVHLENGDVIETGLVLAATGRAPNTKNLGLEEVGVELRDHDGAVTVNDSYQSSIASVYAVGDVTNRVNLTPVAIAEGHWLADTLFAKGRRPVPYDNVPTAIFTQPPCATAGLSEEAARAAGHDVVIYRSTFRAMKYTLSGRDEKTMMKLVVDRESDRVLGAHMVGLDAAEIIQGLAISLAAGATKADFDATIGIHPSSAEEFVTMRTPVEPSLPKAAE